MSTYLKYQLSLLSLLCCLFFSGTTVAKVNRVLNEEPKDVKKQLILLQQERKKLEKASLSQIREEKSLTKELAKLEIEMGEQSDQLRHFEQKRTEHQKILSQYQSETHNLQKTEQAQVASLTKLLQATYHHQKKEKLQLLFSPKEWTHLSRVNHYYQFFYEARAKEISLIKAHLEKLQILSQKIAKENEVISHLAQKSKEKQIQIKDMQTKRKDILLSLSKEKMSVSEKLSLAMQQEQQLEAILQKLSQSIKPKKELPATPVYIDPQINFATMKSKLSLPIQIDGAKLATLPNVSEVQSKKTYIEASAGTPVSAIFGGKVVFAEWLRGVGLLVILDHGNGYLSLYGNNEKLYKSLGEWVNQGEMIARVGQSGGHAQPGLYFEIRKNGEALDPAPWFAQA